MKIYQVVCCFVVYLFLCSLSIAADVRNDIGLQYFDKPNAACENYEGYILGKTDNYTVTSALCGENYVMWLSKKFGMEFKARNLYEGDGAKSPKMIVIDQLLIRRLNKGESFSPVGSNCYQGRKQIEWAAIYNWQGRKKVNKRNGGIVEGWIVNLNIERFEPLPNETLISINCELEDDE